MGDIQPDKYGREMCKGYGTTPHSPTPVEYEGTWDYNCPPNRTHPGEYRTRCPKCHMGYVYDSEELKRHFAGLDLYAKILKARQTLKDAGEL